uniref:Uncharacterized protein n=1 Tax=Aegilops tauschii subsp. strangulata TaxID=200361 RepID=A0A453QIR0_AEGTS
VKELSSAKVGLQDGTFKKGNDTRAPSPPDPKDHGFHLDHPKGESSHDDAFRKETTHTDATTVSPTEAEQGISTGIHAPPSKRLRSPMHRPPCRPNGHSDQPTPEPRSLPRSNTTTTTEATDRCEVEGTSFHPKMNPLEGRRPRRPDPGRGGSPAAGSHHTAPPGTWTTEISARSRGPLPPSPVRPHHHRPANGTPIEPPTSTSRPPLSASPTGRFAQVKHI